MLVPKSILKDWKKLRSNGDLTAIAEVAKKKGGPLATTAASTVSDVFIKGKCSFHLFEVMAAFYKKRKETVATVQKEAA